MPTTPRTKRKPTRKPARDNRSPLDRPEMQEKMAGTFDSLMEMTKAMAAGRPRSRLIRLTQTGRIERSMQPDDAIPGMEEMRQAKVVDSIKEVERKELYVFAEDVCGFERRPGLVLIVHVMGQSILVQETEHQVAEMLGASIVLPAGSPLRGG